MIASCHTSSHRPTAMAWLIIILTSSALFAVPPESKLDPALDYQAERSEPVRYQVEFAAMVTAPYKTKLLRVWLPIPPSNSGQHMGESEFTSFPLPVKPAINEEPLFGNKFAYFEFRDPQGAQLIKHRFEIEVWELRWHLAPEKIQIVSEWPRAFESYRRGESQAVVMDDRFHQLLPQIVAHPGNPLGDMTQVMDWVNRKFTYDHSDASLRADATHGLTKYRGHCSDYHSFCASLGRALGYPTRVTYGINPFPKQSPSHCKLEVFLPPYGWVSFDVSETQKLMQLIDKEPSLTAARKAFLSQAAHDRLLSGFRDNTWFLQTRGTDYDLAPPAASKVPVVRTLYAEADGVPLPEPDPADKKQRGFSWMTAHEYVPNREVTYPFSDWRALEQP